MKLEEYWWFGVTPLARLPKAGDLGGSDKASESILCEDEQVWTKLEEIDGLGSSV
jgi:hypothetical protein